MFRVAIVGGRDFDDLALMTQVCDKLLIRQTDVHIICGMAKGADLTGMYYGESKGYVILKFKPNWKDMAEPCVIGYNRYGEYNKLAGFKRNQEMRLASDAVIAFWDGKSKGTKEMIDESILAGLSVRVIRYRCVSLESGQKVITILG